MNEFPFFFFFTKTKTTIIFTCTFTSGVRYF